MGTSIRYVCLASLISAAVACSATNPTAEEEAQIGETAQAVTSKGKASEGESCLLAPVRRTDKCKPGLTCSTTVGAAAGICVGPHLEAEECDPAFGNAGCAAGLTCTARPSGSGGFCKGPGTGACRTENGGADCAAGKTCIESFVGSGTGTCSTNGTEGSACNDDLVENECAPGFECVVPNQRTGNAGLCTNAAAGGIGALCGPSNPTKPGCALSSYVCAPDPTTASVPGSWGPSYGDATWRCRVPGEFNEICAGADRSIGHLGGQSGCAYGLGCYTNVLGGSTNLLKAGRCDEPATEVGDACGATGANNCTWEGSLNSGGYMSCVNGRCTR
jgi:hypothetical protein